MVDKSHAAGQCLCGAVTVKTENFDPNVGVCHCSMCRKWTGGPFMATDCGKDVRFTGVENIIRYDSSSWAERGFCNKCGTHLFYYLKPQSQYFMAVGLFDNVPDITFDHQVFIDEKPAYYCFAEETRNMTGAEIFAAAEQN